MGHDSLENDLSQQDNSALKAAESFEEKVTQLCLQLEAWRKTEREFEKTDPDELPGPDWKVAGQSLTFFVLGSVVVLVQSWLKFVEGWFTLSLYAILLAICGGASLVLELHALHVFEARYWKEFFSFFRSKDNYPFTPLLGRNTRDFLALKSLERFDDSIVQAVQERFGLLESELRERLSLLGGSSPLPAVLGFATTIWSAFKALQVERSAITIAALIGAILVMLLTGYAFRLRFSVLELARCRALLALEIARRKVTFKEMRPGSSKPALPFRTEPHGRPEHGRP